MKVLERVGAGLKVTSGDIEKATSILSGEDVDDGSAEMEEAHPAAVAVLEPTDLPRWAKNQTELASHLKIERKSIQRWRKEPNFPKPASDGRWDVHAVFDWCKSRGKPIFVGETQEEEKYNLEVRRLRAICERLELSLAIERGDYIEVQEVYKQVSQMVSAVKSQLLSMPSGLAMALLGIDSAVVMQRRLREAVDECLRALAEDDWTERIEKKASEIEEEGVDNE